MGAGALFAVSAGMQAASSIGQAIQARSNAKIQARQYGLQIAQLEQEKKILTEQYEAKRQQLTGSLTAKAAASGVKLSGSVADSLSQSIMELGLEESRQKYNISMNQVNAAYNQKASKIAGKYALISGLTGAATNALSSYATYQYYWGSGDNKGANATGTTGSKK